MASLLKVDTLTGVTTAGSISVTGEGNSTTTNLQQGLAKAWTLDETLYSNSNFVANSFNIASTSDEGTGDMHINFTSGFSSTGYASVAGSGGYSANDTVVTKFGDSTSSKDDVKMQDTAGPTYTDESITYVAHGDLA